MPMLRFFAVSSLTWLIEGLIDSVDDSQSRRVRILYKWKKAE